MTTYFQLYHAIHHPARRRTLPLRPYAANQVTGTDADSGPKNQQITPKSSLLLNPALHDSRPRRRPQPISEQLRHELLETANDNFPPVSPFLGLG